MSKKALNMRDNKCEILALHYKTHGSDFVTVTVSSCSSAAASYHTQGKAYTESSTVHGMNYTEKERCKGNIFVFYAGRKSSPESPAALWPDLTETLGSRFPADFEADSKFVKEIPALSSILAAFGAEVRFGTVIHTRGALLNSVLFQSRVNI